MTEDKRNYIAQAYLLDKPEHSVVACNDGITIESTNDTDTEKRQEACKDHSVEPANQNIHSLIAYGHGDGGDGLKNGVNIIFTCKGSHLIDVTTEERVHFSSINQMLKDALFAGNHLLCSQDPPEDMPGNPYNYKSKNPHYKRNEKGK